MKYISLFTGIGGFDIGFDRASMECVLQVEKDKYARAVLETHWSDVPKMEDVRNVTKESITSTVDLVCGGFPCQDVSVAGNRKGLAGSRSGLWFEFERIIYEIKPEWVVIENVPGLLSSNGGEDFATVVSGLVKCGYGVAWRVLDSQNFGVPQRRRRVFIVGHLGTGRAAQVLFESESVCGNTPPGRETEPQLTRDIAATLRSSGENTGTRIDNETGLCVYPFQDPAPTLGANFASKWGLDDQHINGGGGHFVASIDTRNHTVDRQISATLQAKPNGGYSLNYINPIAFIHNASLKAGMSFGHVSPTLKAQGNRGSQANGVTDGHGVRRLTPTECERLQGFPDEHTAGQSDAQRYKQLGNAVTVNVAEWIGKRIVAAHNH